MAEIAMDDAKLQPLVIFYDSEAAHGNVYYGDVIEIAAKCHPEVVKGSFQTLINTKQPLCAFATKECGISEEDLTNKPFFREVMKRFLSWIDDMVKLANRRHGQTFFPVLCAHYGFEFDFLILLSNMEKCGLHHSILSQQNIHFADSLLLCRELKEKGEKLLANTRLSLDGLFRSFFPKGILKDRHRAMGDVEAMIKIFTQTKLKKLLHHMVYSTTKERVEYYISQSGAKQQQAILEEKLSSLDACSRNMTIKKLTRRGITYNTVRKLFEECCSFLDFYEVMKTNEIERKVAKAFALHFSGQGLANQGTVPYAKTHEKLFTTVDPTPEPCKNVKRDKDVQCDQSEATPLQKKSAVTNTLKTSATGSPQNSKSKQHSLDGEDWETESEARPPRDEFILKCTTPTPLSLNAEDFSSAPLEKNRSKDSSRSQHHNLSSSKVSHSTRRKAAKPVVTANSQQSGVCEHGGTDSPMQSAVNTAKQPRGRSAKTLVKPPPKKRQGKERFSEDGTKKEPVIVTKGKKKEFGEKELSTPKIETTSCSIVKEEKTPFSVVKKTENERQMSSSDARPSPVSFCFDDHPPTKMEKTIQCSMAGSLDSGSSTEKFTSVFIGDIAILVPIEDVEIEHDSQMEDSVPDFTTSSDKPVQEETATGSMTKVEAFLQYIESSPQGSATTPVDEVSRLQSDNDASHQELSKTEETQETELCVPSAASGLNSNGMNVIFEDFLPGGDQLETQDSGNVTVPNDHPTKEDVHLSCATQPTDNPAVEGMNVQPSTPDCGVRSNGDEDSLVQMNSDSVDNHLNELQQVSSTAEVSVISSDAGDQDGGIVGVHQGLASGISRMDQGLDVGISRIDQGLDVGISHTDQGLYGGVVSIDEGLDVGIASMDHGLDDHMVNPPQVDSNSYVDQIHSDSDLQADVSSQSSSTSEEHAVDTFFRQPPLGEERGYTPDSVQQQPAWVGSTNGMYQMPPSRQNVGYGQGSYPPFGNMYGTFNQAAQAVPLIRPYYPSFGYPPAFQPQVAPPPQHTFMSPFQYRNQVMFSNPGHTGLGIPTSALAPQGFRPSLFQFYPGAACYPYTPVSYYEHPYDQTSETRGAAIQASTAVVSESTPLDNAYCQVNSDIGFSSSTVDTSGLNVPREENSSDASSTTSSDNSFDNFPATSETNSVNSWNHVPDNLFGHESVPMPMTHNSTLLSSEGDSSHSSTAPMSASCSGGTENAQTSSSFKSPYGDASLNEGVPEVSGISCIQLSSESDYHVSLGTVDRQQPTSEGTKPVNQQGTTYSHQGSLTPMGRRLSPDGTCCTMDMACADTSTDAKTETSMRGSLEENTVSTCSLADVSVVEPCKAGNIPTAGSLQTRLSSPQRIRQSRNRKHVDQGTSESDSRSEHLVSKGHGVPKVDDGLQSDKDLSRDLDCKVLVKTGKQMHRSANQRKVRFSKAKVKEGVPSDDELEEVAVEIGDSWESLGRRLMYTCSKAERLLITETSRKNDEHSGHSNKTNKDRSRRYDGTDSKPSSIRVNASQRGLHGEVRRTRGVKQWQKQPPPRRVKESDKDNRTDKNNN